MPSEAPVWEDTTEVQTPAWEDTAPVEEDFSQTHPRITVPPGSEPGYKGPWTSSFAGPTQENMQEAVGIISSLQESALPESKSKGLIPAAYNTLIRPLVSPAGAAMAPVLAESMAARVVAGTVFGGLAAKSGLQKMQSEDPQTQLEGRLELSAAPLFALAPGATRERTAEAVVEPIREVAPKTAEALKVQIETPPPPAPKFEETQPVEKTPPAAVTEGETPAAPAVSEAKAPEVAPSEAGPATPSASTPEPDKQLGSVTKSDTELAPNLNETESQKLADLTDKAESGVKMTAAEKKQYVKLRDKANAKPAEEAHKGISAGPGASSWGDIPNQPRQAIAAAARVEQAPPEHKPFGGMASLSVAMDKVKGALSDIPTTLKGLAGYSLPKTTAIDRKVGEAGVRYASSRIAARPRAEVFSSSALQDTDVDPVKLGAALTEDNLMSVRESLRAKVTRLISEGKEEEAAQAAAEADNVASIIGSKGSPFKTQDEYLDFLEEPATKKAIDQHIQLWQESVEPMFKQAMDLDPDTDLGSRGQQTGARINLKAVLPDEEQANPVKGVPTSSGLTATFKRKSPFAAQAKGSGIAYDVDYHSIIRNTFEKQLEVANKNAFDDALVKSGNAVIDSPGKVVMIGGKPAVGFPISRKVLVQSGKGQPQSLSLAKNIYVNQDLASEYRTASGVDKRWHLPLVTPVMNVLNKAALSGLTDATVHVSNQATALFNRPVSGRLWMDTLLSATGRADIPITMTKAIIKAFKNNSEQEAQMATIGSMRPQDIHFGYFGKALQSTDKITRLVLDDTYKNLVKEGVIADSETARREYSNQIGQYNRRLQGPFTRFLRDTGFGPFVTAGKTFNALGVKMATLSPGAPATSNLAAAALRVNALSKWVGAGVFIATMNHLITGNMTGRPGTPIGNIDTGKNGPDGKQLSFPFLNLIGLGRALRVTGVKGSLDSKRMGLTDADAMEAASRDIINSWSAPAAGPGIKFGMIGASGYGPAVDVPRVSRVVPPGENQRLENLKEALRQASPLAQSFIKYEQGKTWNEIASSQLPRFTLTPGKTEAMVSKYPRIVSMAQGNAFIDDMIHEARRMPKNERIKFVNEQIARLPREQQDHARKEVRRRHTYD